MDTNYQPLVALFGYVSGGGRMTFVGRKDDFTLTMGDHLDEFVRILSLCNGYRTLEQVRAEVKDIDEATFRDLMDAARELGVVRDSRELYLGFHEDSANPMRFTRKISPQEVGELVQNHPAVPRSTNSVVLPEVSGALLGLCGRRQSCREFTGEPLKLSEVSGLLRTTYTLGEHRSIPSAGQLYPLDVYVAVAVSSEELAKGLYRYDPERLTLNPVGGKPVTPDTLGGIFNSYQAEGAAVVVFIAADLKRNTAKYTNRGYRYALMEAGHAAQNAYLYCAEAEGLGMVECGGFQDRLASEWLGLDYPNQAVLLALVVGRRDPNGRPKPNLVNRLWELGEQVIGEGKPIEWVYIFTPTGKEPFRTRAMAKYRPPNKVARSIIKSDERYGTGVSVSREEAAIKAIGEAYERYAAGLLRFDAVGPAASLNEQWLDPRVVTPLHRSGYERYGWQEFDPSLTYQWLAGRRYSSGEKVMVPVEHVFYPLTREQLGRRLCYACSSNGMAVYPDAETAVLKAMLELAERDAVSVAWYSQRQVSSLPEEMLSEDTRLRISYWVKKGWSVRFLNLTLDSVPVVLCLISSEREHPALAAGAAADFSFEKASAKAWDEAEMLLTGWRRRRSRKALSPDTVRSPLDHGKLYFKAENLKYVRWLLEASQEEPLPPRTLTPAELLGQFDPVTVDMTPANSGCDLVAVRVISEKLLPINFGYMNEHIGHRRLSDLGLEWKREFPSFPHFFP